MGKSLIASVVLEKTAYSFDKYYDYILPEGLLKQEVIGCRVLVPFGKGNSERVGLIMSVKEGAGEQLKAVKRVVDAVPVLNNEMLKLCEWLHESLFCTYFDAVNMLLPAGISFKITDSYAAVENFSQSLSGEEGKIFEYLKAVGAFVPLNIVLRDCEQSRTDRLNSLLKKGAVVKNTEASRKIGDAKQKCVRPASPPKDNALYRLTEKQKAVVEKLSELGSASVKRLSYICGVSLSVVDSLVKKGLAEYYEERLYRTPLAHTGIADRSEIVLTAEQQSAFDTLKEKLNVGGNALLFGITGSGKTQVYLKLVDAAVENNKGVIIMVPEISLTPQVISIFSKRYGDKISVFHSAMSYGERMDEWQRVKEGRAKIAIGTRSAVFAPFEDLGLIIMDEEQEHTYKSEQSPRFHTRDISRFRAAYHKALFLMASATPSVETYTKALSGKYTLCRLNNRYGGARLPETQIVDMRSEIQQGNTGAISNPLYMGICEALENKKQAIVLLNRRGHNTYISCPSCGTVQTCPNCSVSLTYHSANKSLMCHYCGYTKPRPKHCEECGNERLKFTGFGTQKVEQELKELFPDARVLRLDADSTASKDSYTKYLTAFGEGEYDIMLGTQMVAKGLDFPNVTVVGVVGADKSLNSEDYRSCERTFSLLTQVIGRAGRGQNEGVAIIQTNDPDNSVIHLARLQDYDAFYQEEVLLRKGLVYPPYCDLISVSAASASKDLAENTAMQVAKNIKEAVSGKYSDVPVIVLGPAAASVAKVNNKYRYRLIIKTKNNSRMRSMLRSAIDFKYERDISVVIDINPEVIL